MTSLAYGGIVQVDEEESSMHPYENEMVLDGPAQDTDWRYER
jgi:hypothetical protein